MCISQTVNGMPEAWPNIIIPVLKVVMEYDDTDRDDRSDPG
ncbi:MULTISPECIES: hypothetical protein [Cryobacterium]|nr:MULTISPECIES: hypothetical protein [Cryobacterium]